MKESVAVIVWTVDPEGKLRFLLRHNKPFNGYEDEWTVCFGGIEEGEMPIQAALREVSEEYGLVDIENMVDLDYSIVWQNNTEGVKERASFFALRIKGLSVQIILNGESIGYDWLLYHDALRVMKYEDESRALALVVESQQVDH